MGMTEMNKIKAAKYQTILNILSLLVWGGTILYLIISWNTIPQKIPGHYNGRGIIDRWGNKSELLIPLVIGIIMYLGLSLIERCPKIWNTGIEVNETNREKVYSLTKGLLVTSKFFLTLNFSFLTINSSLSLSLPNWYTLVFVGLLFVMIIVYIIKFILLSREVKEKHI